MRGSIASLKENLNKIALDVHDDSDIEIYGSSNGGTVSTPDRRSSNGFAFSRSVSRSPVANGFDSPSSDEIGRYEAEIKRLQESEAQIKALSVNYAALLKEKEDQISRLSKENGSLKQDLEATDRALKTARSEASKAVENKGSHDQPPGRLCRATSPKFRNQIYNGVVSRPDGMGSDYNSQGKEKELADLLEDRERALAAVHATIELQKREFKMELEKEHEKLAKLRLKLEEEHKLNNSLKDEMRLLQKDKDNTSAEMRKLSSELDAKIAEIRHLQMGVNQLDKGVHGGAENLREVISALEKENKNLKRELEGLQMSQKLSSRKIHPDAQEAVTTHTSNLNEESLADFPGREEMEISLNKLEKELKETRGERDKAVQQLSRLKQHLLEKESEDSEKMDEDSRLIEGLRQTNEYQRAQISQLEKALKQAIAGQDEVKMTKESEMQKYKDMINDLNKRLASCMRTIDAKNAELLNLQTALGQYYAEIEAKEHLERDLASAKEELAKFSNLLKDADERLELSKREKEEIHAKLLQAERTVAEGKNRVMKLEEDNAKVRRALEQSMTRLNRMSVDSDFLVDRRIVIKLLVTYFQRNHSKEVLDLMVRMLGFSEEDKQRIGVAQQGAGKGVVRGVLGLPGRFVGGILRGGSGDAHAKAASENQSFADLWVDFLLKETEERERREFEEEADRPSQATSSPSAPDKRALSSSPGLARSSFSPPPLPGSYPSFEHSDSEFSTVPLTSSDSNPRFSRPLIP